MEAGLVSTIIPVFNRPSRVREAVASVLAQSYRPIEVIVVDDGSSDDTPGVLEELAATHPEVRVLRQENAGPGAARERGRLAARGELIQHLDSDDVLLPEKFAMQVTGLQAHPECGVSFGWTRLRHADGTLEPRPWKRSGEPIETMFPAMLQSRWWDTPNPLYRASLIERAGPWMTTRVEEDWEYDCRIAARNVRLHHCEEWVCEVRLHDEGHLSAGPPTAASLHDRAEAHVRILGHGRAAGIAAERPEMQHFGRELFLLGRQCGATGLIEDSRRLIALAASVRPWRDVRAYQRLAQIIGWRNAARLAAWRDRLRATPSPQQHDEG